MKRDDTLWKGILEDLIVDFLRFFYKEADQLQDLDKKVEFLDTEMAQISEAGDLELNKSQNPFAFVIVAVLLALKKRKTKNIEDEDDLLQLKIALARKLLDQQFSKPVIKGIYYFIRNYVVFENKENDRIFDSTIDSVTDKNKTMGK